MCDTCTNTNSTEFVVVVNVYDNVKSEVLSSSKKFNRKYDHAYFDLILPGIVLRASRNLNISCVIKCWTSVWNCQTAIEFRIYKLFQFVEQHLDTKSW